MNWLALSLVSAACLGLYDVAKKRALLGASSREVLAKSTAFGFALVCLLVVVLSLSGRATVELSQPSLRLHGLVLCKALLVSASWLCTYRALAQLPLSVAAPIRSSAPFFTILAATLLLGERPSPQQSAGLGLVLAGYWLFAVLGKAEGIHFSRDRQVGLLMLGTLLGAASGTYDKLLLDPKRLGLSPLSLQFWFSFYSTLIFGSLYRLKPPSSQAEPPPKERSIAAMFLVGSLLLAADFAYFRALAAPESLLSVVSLLRRSSVLLSFTVGGLLFGEKQLKRKSLALGFLLGGVLLLSR